MAQRTSVLRTGKAPVQDPTQLPSGLDTTTFFFPAIPAELKPLIPLLHSTSIEHVSTCLQAVVNYLQLQYGGKYVAIDKAVYASTSAAMTMDDTNVLLTGLYFILRIAIRNKIKLSVMKGDLTKMNVPNQVVDLLAHELQRCRLSIEAHVLTHRIQFHKLEKVRWRIDVVISTGSLSRVMKPSILMQMIMKDGRVVTFDISVEQFHQLRYNVAKVLHDMQTLERHPIIKIVNEFKRREEEDYNN